MPLEASAFRPVTIIAMMTGTGEHPMRIALILLAGTVLTACTDTAAKPPVAELASAPAAKPEIGAFGFDVHGMDRSVAAGDNFYTYANGGWEKATPIPADRSNYGMFTKLDDLSFERTRSIIEEAATLPGSKIGDLYASFMDEVGVDAKGIAPVQTHIDAIRKAQSRADMARLAGRNLRDGLGATVGFYIGIDDKDPDSLIVTLVQGGLSLPDRDYYLKDDPNLAAVRAAFVTHATRMLTLAGEKNAAARARALLAFETEIARTHWTKVESRDADNAYNKLSLADLERLAPGYDWNSFFTGAGAKVDSLIVAQPSAIAGTARLFARTPLPVLRDHMLLHLLDASAPYLSKPLVDEQFAFYGTTLGGTPENRARWKRGVNLVKDAMGDAVGQIYVERHFPPEAKATADELVKNIIAAMDRRLSSLEWMTPATREKARAKLASFKPKIGYPDKWRDYSALEVRRDDLFGNVVRANRFEFDRKLSQLGKPADRDEWFMTPMEVNAYANPTWNEIVFPAAILQPPFFDPHADPAINYGGIGAVIGHEISHHFDDQGRKYDATGRLAGWWTPEDVERFKRSTDQLVAQYDAYEPLPGMHVQGKLTLGENIADLAGLTVAYDAYVMSLGGKAPPVIDGFSADQRFYLGWAQIWRRQYREANLRQRLLTDPHSPSEQRAWVVRNLDPWYGAFGVTEGRRLYLAPEARVRIW